MTREEKFRELAVLLGVCLLLGGGCFSIGRFSAPMKVETRDVFKDRIVEVEKVVERVVTVERAAKTETRIVWRDRVVAKDGTVTEKTVEKTAAVEESAKTSQTAKTADRTVEAERIKFVTRTVTLRPNWRVGVLVGASFQQPLLPIAGPLTLGALGEYRVAGGLWIGLWTLPQHGAAGASVSLEF